MEVGSPALQADSLPAEQLGKPICRCMQWCVCVHACLCVCKCLCSIRMCLSINVYVWGDVASRRRKQGLENSLETGAVEKNSKKLVSWGPSLKPMSFQSRTSLFGNMNRGLTAQDWGPTPIPVSPHRCPQLPVATLTEAGCLTPLNCGSPHHVPEFSVNDHRGGNENLGHDFSNCFLLETRNNFSLDSDKSYLCPLLGVFLL